MEEEAQNEELAERRAVREYMRLFLDMKIEQEEILITKRGKTENIYVQFRKKDTAIEAMRRGNMARKKNQNLKISNYMPPQWFNRWKAAWDFAKRMEESDTKVAMVTVRFSNTDV